MEDEHSISNNNHSNDIVQMSSSSTSSNARRVHIRRGVFRQTTTLRSSPYNPSLSNLRRRRRQQTSRITSETISNLITNIENPPDVNASLIDPEEIDVFSSESEIVQDNFLVTSDDENPNDQFEVLADFSQTSPTDLTMINEHHNDVHEHDESYHSISTIDFDPEDEDDDDDDDDDHRYYYTSRSIPVFDYSSSTEPLIVHNHPIDMTQEQYDDAYSPSINDDEDLSIEIILESSQNNSLPILTPPPSRRRRSIIPAHIQHNRGLRSSDILSIPQKMYSSLKEQLNDKYQSTTIMNTQCYICLEDFQSIDSIKILHCQHIFHTRCVNEWLRHHSNCAYCRTPVVVDILRSSSATIGRRQRTRVRRNHNTISRSSTNGSIEQTSSESFSSEQQ